MIGYAAIDSVYEVLLSYRYNAIDASSTMSSYGITLVIVGNFNNARRSVPVESTPTPMIVDAQSLNDDELDAM